MLNRERGNGVEKQAGGAQAKVHASAAVSCWWRRVCGRPSGLFLVPESMLAVPSDLRRYRPEQRLVTRTAPEALML